MFAFLISMQLVQSEKKKDINCSPNFLITSSNLFINETYLKVKIRENHQKKKKSFVSYNTCDE